MSLFPENVLTREIETRRGFIDKLPSDEDKVVLTKLLDSCYELVVAINNHAQEHPFPSESLIMALLLKQHKMINYLNSMQSKTADNQSEDD
jgi:hypothetical protein